MIITNSSSGNGDMHEYKTMAITSPDMLHYWCKRRPFRSDKCFLVGIIAMFLCCWIISVFTYILLRLNPEISMAANSQVRVCFCLIFYSLLLAMLFISLVLVIAFIQRRLLFMI